MTKIKLQSICLRNFKGTRFLLLNTNGMDAHISGANGTGKTTIYKAYYWCLTGKTLEPNEIVQSLNIYNEVIHKVETSVMVTLRIDDSYDMTLERKLVEKWKALGRPNEELKGTEQQRFWNDVPLSQKEFDAKLNAVADLNQWLLLSDITKFMSLKTDDRRRLLLSIAGEVDEGALLSPFPSLRKAIEEKKTIDELKIQTLSTKKRANEELKTIPSQISAQDKLKVNENFAALRTEKEALDIQIADLDKVMQGSTDELQAVTRYNKDIEKIETEIEEYKHKWNSAHDADIEEHRKIIARVQKQLEDAQTTEKKHKQDNEARIEQKVKLQEEFAELRNEWCSVNGSEFDYESEECCPLCGHKFTVEEKNSNRATAIADYNRRKTERLKNIQTDAERKNAQILVLTGSINEYDKVIRPQDEKAVKAQETVLIEAQRVREQLLLERIETDAKYITLQKRLDKARKNRPVMNDDKQMEQYEEKKREVVATRDRIIHLLAGEQTNHNIDAEKERLEERSKELSQIIADCDEILWEVTEYRKTKVDAVENKVNSFFNLAKWKFYEKNVSNDDLQEVCICHHNGIDYNSTNGADRINLGVDIISGLSKAYELYVPLFIDNAESVNELIPIKSQTITLRVTTEEFKMDLV